MLEQKTKVNNNNVTAFLNTIADEKKRKDCFALTEIMKQVSKEEPKMWGTSIIGFGAYHYKYASGHQGDAPLIGFSPRKQNIVLYLMGGFHTHPEVMKKLGKHKAGKGCLYISNMDDVNIAILKEVIELSMQYLKKQIEMGKKNIN